MPTDMEMMSKPGMMSPGKTDDKRPAGKMQSEGGSTTLPLDKYPELQGLAQGQKIKGTFEGIIDAIDNANAKVSYTMLELDTENSADKEMGRIMGSGKDPKDHKVGDEADDQDM